jgi:predicted acyltransferase
MALDVFRGITVAGMLLVNDPGSWGHIFAPLEHAPWNGWTPTDLIFPFFLFIVGITTTLSLTTRRARGDSDAALTRQVLRRGAIIVALGLFVSWFPGFTWGSVTGIADPSLLDRVRDRLLHVRGPGILQRIGVVYIVAGLIALRTSLRTQLLCIVGILLGYWAIMTLVPVPDSGRPGWAVMDQPSATLAAWFDRLLLDWSSWGGGNHIWAQSVTWDPEGPLSTLPAVATTLLGLVAGRWIVSDRSLSDRLVGLLAAGAILAAAGCMWGWIFPINKNLWTSSFVLLTAGLGALTLGTCLWLIDSLGLRRWSTPFMIYGVNPIVAFVGSDMMARLIYSVIAVPSASGPVPLETAIYRSAFASWLDPRLASLAFAVSFVLLWLAVLTVLYKRRVFVKV